jgi:hypothetical protein
LWRDAQNQFWIYVFMLYPVLMHYPEVRP